MISRHLAAAILFLLSASGLAAQTDAKGLVTAFGDVCLKYATPAAMIAAGEVLAAKHRWTPDATVWGRRHNIRVGGENPNDPPLFDVRTWKIASADSASATLAVSIVGPEFPDRYRYNSCVVQIPGYLDDGAISEAIARLIAMTGQAPRMKGPMGWVLSGDGFNRDNVADPMKGSDPVKGYALVGVSRDRLRFGPTTSITLIDYKLPPDGHFRPTSSQKQ